MSVGPQASGTQPRGTLDLAATVATSRTVLADMNRDEAIAMLRETANQATGKVTRAQLEFVIKEMSSGPERPFEHAYHWAAFFSQGSDRLEVPWE